jgi:hypothetical protein
MKKLVGHGFSSESKIPPSVETSAMPMLSSSAASGRCQLRASAGDGGPRFCPGSSRTLTTFGEGVRSRLASVALCARPFGRPSEKARKP